MQIKNKKLATPMDASKLRIGIVYSQYYLDEVTSPMLQGAREVLAESGVAEKNIIQVPVSGSWEIPYGCVALLKKKKVDAVITIGCIIKGETSHDHHISAAVTGALMNLMLAYKVPISLGIINANTLDQARARSTGENNKGKEAAIGALEATLLRI